MKIHRHPHCPHPRKRIGGASSPFSGGKNCGVGFRSQKAGTGSDGKGRRSGIARLNSLHLIHLRAQPLLRLSGSVAGAARTLVKSPSSKRVSPPPGSEAHAVDATHNAGSRLPREPTLHASLPVRPSQKLCVSRSWYSVGREEQTDCNVIYFRPYMPLIYLLPSLFLFSFFLISYLLWQTTVNRLTEIYVTDTHRELCWMTKR